MKVYPEKIANTIRKYANDRSETDKEDISQECFLALLSEGELSADEAGKVITETVMRMVKSQKPPVLLHSLTDPTTMFQAEDKHNKNPDYFLDSKTLIDRVNSLPSDEFLVICALNGIHGQKEHTYAELAKRIGETVGWVREREKTALRKLKEMLK